MKPKKRKKKHVIYLEWKDQDIHTKSWFQKHKISNQLIYKYAKTGLITKIGRGVYTKANKKLYWKAGILAAQKELKLPFHVEGLSSLELQGKGHYIRFGRPSVLVAIRKNIKVPEWLKNNKWDADFHFRQSKLFKDNTGLIKSSDSNFPLIISCKERAILEFIDKSPLRESFEPVEQHCQGLLRVRSELIQKLLMSCTSVRVKRVFLYVCSKLKLSFIKRLDIEKIDLGKGKRVVYKKGELDNTFKITVPPTDDWYRQKLKKRAF